MAGNQQAKKNKGTRNDARKNGKAAKNRAGHTGSSPKPPTELEKVLLGKGMYTRWAKKAIQDKPRGVPSKRLKDSDD